MKDAIQFGRNFLTCPSCEGMTLTWELYCLRCNKQFHLAEHNDEIERLRAENERLRAERDTANAAMFGWQNEAEWLRTTMEHALRCIVITQKLLQCGFSVAEINAELKKLDAAGVG